MDSEAARFAWPVDRLARCSRDPRSDERFAREARVRGVDRGCVGTRQVPRRLKAASSPSRATLEFEVESADVAYGNVERTLIDRRPRPPAS